ncbi:sister chromatid separation protein-like protein [Lepidopterella palustris CBS 459.81]|uniref:Sister chromatid separation protein-like protein n=1 Tax=Lepidopterella palustris CBS 459.81 TaxID=1314670 RepID=A0A8E2JF24_9PEZI|nr:sister chromatid separation protein-like protein [Lepidopterella palustris CBS 459.81]
MASALDDYQYLDPDFDPSSLKVPQLRSILVAHDIQYPSSANKPKLVELFNEHIAPQASTILRARSRTKRSARGIKDVAPSQASTVDEDEEEETLAPPPTVKRTSRRTTRAATEEEPDRVLNSGLPQTRAKTPSKAASAKHARASDAELDEQPAVRRTRHSVPPVFKDEEPEPEAWHRHDAESPFSAENPFQSGSSPPAPESRADRRRKTLGPPDQREKRKSGAVRRRTEQPKVEQLDDGVVVPTRRTFEMPITRVKKEEPLEDTDGVEAGEEFTPEEQLELVRERAKTGQADILPPRQRKQASQSSSVLKAGAWAIIIVILGGIGGIWRQEKLEVGYCGVGRESTSLAGLEIPQWAADVLPSCEPCPQHAYCYANLHTVCEPDFILKPHPLSLGGVVPLPPTCEPDSEKARRINTVTDRTVDILRERRAKWECGDLVDDQGKPIPNVEMAEEELKEEMSAKRRKGMSQDEFEDLWKGAMGEIIGRDEIVENIDGNTGTRTLTSTSLARVPLACAFRRWLRLSLERHIWELVGIIVLVASGFYGRATISYNRETEIRAKHLAKYALDRLAQHAALNHQEPGAYPEVGISMTQLRDDILRDEFSASRRHKLWVKVQNKVEHNSNVRAAVREGRNGDVGRMWEWIGPVQFLEDGRGSGRRESSRYSFGPFIGGDNLAMRSPSNDRVGRQEIKENRSWDEGRPVY